MKNLIENLVVTLQSRFTYVNVIEILIIAFVIYKILMWIRGTQAEQVAKGIIIVLLLAGADHVKLSPQQYHYLGGYCRGGGFPAGTALSTGAVGQ